MTPARTYPAGADTKSLAETIRDAAAIAAQHADDVDRASRFPVEALQALKQGRALSAFVPRELGGAGVSFDSLCQACFDLSRRCSATGMVFAMHQIQVGSIVRHWNGAGWFTGYLEELVRDQRLIASATSEVGTGGDLRASIAAVEYLDNGRARFEKKSSTCSYGAHADDVLTTVRRAPDADHADQVMILTRCAESNMTPVGAWDTLGMRGTCSPPFVIRAEFSAEQILPKFATAAAETMVPWSHLLWAHVWLGIATDAFDRAQAFVRSQARQTPGITPPAATKLSALSADLAKLRGLIHAAQDEYNRIADEPGRETLSTMGYAVRINNLKIAASESAADLCQAALKVCGISGYRNGTPYSVGRHLRDSLSAALMIANERIHSTNATLLLVHREAR
jgi:acyl-CoA dehydrogenase